MQWNTDYLHLPNDRKTIEKWSRAFFNKDPYIKSVIDLFAEYPISKLAIKEPNMNIKYGIKLKNWPIQGQEKWAIMTYKSFVGDWFADTDKNFATNDINVAYRLREHYSTATVDVDYRVEEK